MLCSPLHLFGLDYAVFPADRDRGSVSKHLYLYFAVLTCAQTYLVWDEMRNRLYVGIGDIRNIANAQDF